MSHRRISAQEPDSVDERLYATLAGEISQIAIFLIDEDGLIATCNRGVEKILRYSRSEFIGKPSDVIFTPEDKAEDQPRKEMERAFQTGMSEDLRWQVRKDGSRFWCEGLLYRLRDEDGTFLGYAKLLRDASRCRSTEDERQPGSGRLDYPAPVLDVTLRNEAEADREGILAESARRAAELDAILASIPEGVYFGDETGINKCNDRGLQILGLGAKEDLQHPVSELIKTIGTRFPDTNEPIPFDRQPFIRALRGETCVEEVAVRRVDTGEEVILRSAAAPVRLDGTVVGAVAVNSDITYEKQIELERERLLAALSSSNEELSQFAYVVSHDLQAPLRAVTSFAQLLRRRYGPQLDDDAESIISSILEGTQNMGQLISAVLQYARAGQQSPALQPIALTTLIDAVLLTLSPEIKDTGAHIHRMTEMPVVETDWVQISQVFQNLIGNALKYRKSDVPPEIKLSTATEEAEWVIAVEDNGIGIEPIYFERIFEPLKRLHGRELPGTGIGLAICRRIVQRFGGRIWVESQLGVGSKFTFTLPR